MVSLLVKDILKIYDKKELVDKVDDSTDRLVVLLGDRLSGKQINPNVVYNILFYAIEAGIEYGIKTSEGLVDYLHHLTEDDKASLVKKLASGVDGL